MAAAGGNLSVLSGMDVFEPLNEVDPSLGAVSLIVLSFRPRILIEISYVI
jgi:hypothetical protein